VALYWHRDSASKQLKYIYIFEVKQIVSTTMRKWVMKCLYHLQWMKGKSQTMNNVAFLVVVVVVVSALCIWTALRILFFILTLSSTFHSRMRLASSSISAWHRSWSVPRKSVPLGVTACTVDELWWW